jgi:hypothetical protein
MAEAHNLAHSVKLGSLLFEAPGKQHIVVPIEEGITREAKQPEGFPRGSYHSGGIIHP